MKKKKDWIARELTVEIVVGVFLVCVFLGLAVFTIVLGKHRLFDREQTELQITFRNVMGLRVGDDVVVRGMTAGKVSDLQLVENRDGNHRVQVTAALDFPLQLRQDYRITVFAVSILGGRYLDIEEGTDTLPRVAETAYLSLKGREPYDIVVDTGELVSAVKEGLVDGKIIENAQEIVAQMKVVTARLSEGKGTLGKLLSEDDALYKDAAATVAALRTMAEAAKDGKGFIGQLVKDEKLYKDVASTVAAIRQVAEGVQEGKGLIGRMLTDDSLYGKVAETIDDIQATMDDLRETSPVTTFTSVFFGAF
jgi:ABC-type transporter Mla subunit MlaD